MIKGLHHNAYRCRDAEETRKFYEDFLGLPLAQRFEINETKTGRATDALHTFYQMDDGSCLAFFEVPDEPVRVQAAARFRPAHRARSPARRPRARCREGQGRGHRDARRRRPRHHRLDLFPRSQRLCDRADRQAARTTTRRWIPRPTRPAPISTPGRRPRPPARAERGPGLRSAPFAAPGQHGAPSASRRTTTAGSSGVWSTPVTT